MVQASAATPRHDPYRLRITHETDLVKGAIDLVAGGGARRVSLVLQHGAQILPAAQAQGRQWGVIVRAVWREADAGCDLIVEPVS